MERNLQEEICGYYNSINHVQNQMQMQLDKQTLIQFQDLANCIRILGTALSLAENYAIMNGYNTKSKEFTHYDYYNASQNTEKNLYFKKFCAMISNLDGVYEYYISHYQTEPLPKSLKKEDIISRLESYKKYMNPNEQRIYNDFINVLHRKPIPNVSNVINNFKGSGRMDPNKIIQTFLEAGEQARYDNEVIENKYIEDPNSVPDIIMNKNEPSIGKDYHKKYKK
jgi:hypothetical protein